MVLRSPPKRIEEARLNYLQLSRDGRSLVPFISESNALIGDCDERLYQFRDYCRHELSSVEQPVLAASGLRSVRDTERRGKSRSRNLIRSEDSTYQLIPIEDGTVKRERIAQRAEPVREDRTDLVESVLPEPQPLISLRNFVR